MEDNKTQTFTPADFKNEQTARWCPGCGDHAILKRAPQGYGRDRQV